MVWRKNEGTNNPLSNNSLPGPIGQPHYNQWRANFGKPPGSGASSPSRPPLFPSRPPGLLWIVAARCRGIGRRGLTLNRSDTHAIQVRQADERDAPCRSDLQSRMQLARQSDWTRRKFVPRRARLHYGARRTSTCRCRSGAHRRLTGVEAIDFPSSYLYCSLDEFRHLGARSDGMPRLPDRLASGETNEYVMGVMAKTGLAPVAGTGKIAPGYDYWIIFSKTHVFTKRSHSSAYLNNPTVLEHKDFGEANWRFHRASAKPLRSAADDPQCDRELAADDGENSVHQRRRCTAIQHRVSGQMGGLLAEGRKAFAWKLARCSCLNSDKSASDRRPQFEDFQWAHFDYHTFDRVRCLLEQPTSILADATFTPPAEHGRENRDDRGVDGRPSEGNRGCAPFWKITFRCHAKSLDSLLSTDHYSRANEVSVTNELYALRAIRMPAR